MLEGSGVLCLEVLKFHACQGVTAAHAAAQFGHAPMLHLLTAEGAAEKEEMETAGDNKQRREQGQDKQDTQDTQDKQDKHGVMERCWHLVRIQKIYLVSLH